MANQNTSYFDFGGGVNFNPMANGGATPSAGGSGGYMPSWSPSTSGVGTNAPAVNSFTGSNTGSTGLYPTSTYYPSAQNLTSDQSTLGHTFGDLGPYLASMIQTGGYNPQVFQALVNQLQPQVNEGVATINASTGASGTRFGSGNALALGDYLSQVNLNESSMAAGLYEQSVQNSLQALGMTAPSAAQYKSNQGGMLSSILSSLLPILGPGIASGIIKGSGAVGSGGGGNQYGNIAGSQWPSTMDIGGSSNPLGSLGNLAGGSDIFGMGLEGLV